ncbi:MAG: beta-galactosidase trimerization domain-containing protein [Armatimonadetes bacterium]|nr:beta-galactosidase trimerization domain-containing protein [Armatimonadota bacterium]
MTAEQVNEDSWIEQSMIHFTWARHGKPMTRAWTHGILDKAELIHANAVIFGIHLGGYVAYQSNFTPSVAGMELDVLEELCNEGHRRGLRIIPYWLSTNMGGALHVHEHPDWVAVNSKGVQTGFICHSTPYADVIEAQVREVTKNYAIDGVFIDQSYCSCACSYCKENFRRRFGREMPEWTSTRYVPEDVWGKTAKETGLLRTFWLDNLRHFCWRIQKAVKETRESVLYIQSVVYDATAQAVAPYVDAICSERHLHYQRNINDIVISNRLAAAYSKKPIISQCLYGYTHHAKERPVEHFHLILMEGAATGCSPCLMELNICDDNQNRSEDLEEAGRQIRWTSEAMRDTQPVKYAALLHSKSSEGLLIGSPDVGNDVEPGALQHFKNGKAIVSREHRASFDGYYDILKSRQVPVEFITETDLDDDTLFDYKVLILPNVLCISDKNLQRVKEFAAAGGGVVATHRTGELDEDGRPRTASDIADLIGATPMKLIARDLDVPTPSLDPRLAIPSVDVWPNAESRYFHYVRAVNHPIMGELNGMLLSFTGAFVDVDDLPGSSVAAHILAMDQSRVSMQPFNRRGLFPGDVRGPLVVTSEKPGKVVYIAAQLEPIESRVRSREVDDLLYKAVTWAGGPLPVECGHCPPTLHITYNTNLNTGSLVLVLTNQSVVSALGTIRYIVPVSNIELKVKLGKKRIKEIQTATGQEIHWKQEQDTGVVAIPEVHVAECLVIRLE